RMTSTFLKKVRRARTPVATFLWCCDSLLEVGQHCVAKELDLTSAIVTPDFQQDVRAARFAILLDAVNAFIRSAGDWADFAQDVVGYGLSRGFSSALFHGRGHGAKFVEGEPGAFEQDIGRALDVLNLVGQVHGRLFARAFLTLP